MNRNTLLTSWSKTWRSLLSATAFTMFAGVAGIVCSVFVLIGVTTAIVVAVILVIYMVIGTFSYHYGYHSVREAD